MADVNSQVFEPFKFDGDFSPRNMKVFLAFCAELEVSDIIIQGGDYIWLEIHGRQKRGSVERIQNGVIESMIAPLWRDESIVLTIKSGVDVDRKLEIVPDAMNDYGLKRGKSLGFRTNFIQADIGAMSRTITITIRYMGDDIPTYDKYPIEPDLKESLLSKDGLIFICGPTGSGKTTLLSANYHYILSNYADKKVITFEDPIEINLGGPHCIGPQPAQSQIGRDIPTFAAGLRNAMRRAPKIIGIGEARDLETFSAALAAATSGHLCYATLHVMSCAEAIPRIYQAFPAIQQPAVAADLINTLRVICVQNLFKTTDGRRTSVREYFIISPEIRQKLLNLDFTKWGMFIRDYLQERKATIIDKAWSLHKEGRISKEEFIDKAGWSEYENRCKYDSTQLSEVS